MDKDLEDNSQKEDSFYTEYITNVKNNKNKNKLLKTEIPENQ